MRHLLAVGRLAVVAALCAGAAAAQPSRLAPRAAFANPIQSWSSADGLAHLLRPLQARVATAGGPVGALTSGGWRLVWDGSPVTPGRLLVRLSLPVAPQPPQTRTTEYLQVGVGRAAHDVRTCASYGLKGGSATRLPDRIINGRRFAAWRNSDAGMSQSVSALDLRTVAGGVCYAVERFSYGDAASDPDPSVRLPAATGSAELDAALASLQLGPLRPGEALQPPPLRLPPGAVAR